MGAGVVIFRSVFHKIIFEKNRLAVHVIVQPERIGDQELSDFVVKIKVAVEFAGLVVRSSRTRNTQQIVEFCSCFTAGT